MMTEKINNISQIIRSTEEYSDVCDMCRDEILLYPTISGRTNYTQEEVEEITLKRIIDKLKRAKQEYEELRQDHNDCCEEFKQEINLRINAYNKLSRDFWSGKYCNTKHCQQLQAKEQECKNYKEKVEYIHAFLRNPHNYGSFRPMWGAFCYTGCLMKI